MEDRKQQDKKERKGIIPLFWWFGGALLAGGLLYFAWLNHKSKGEIQYLGNTLTDTKSAWESEKQSFLQKLSEASDRFNTLKSELAVETEKRMKERDRNRRLSAQNDDLNRQQEQSKSEYAKLNEQLNAVSAENAGYKTERDVLRNQVDQLMAMLKDKDALNQDQADVIKIQESRISSDSVASVAFVDSMRRVHTRQFFNATDLAGGIGLYNRKTPYSQYFYGLTTVNGIMIDNHFMGGLGIGLLNFDAGLVAPLFVEFRYSFGSSGFSPYVYTDGGFELKFGDFENSNLFINPGVGLTKKLNEKIALDLGLGFYQHREAIRSSFVNFKLGIVFLGKDSKPVR